MANKKDTMKKQLKELEKAFHDTKEELDIQTWGLKKTNEAIKLLYKELEEKNRKLRHLDQLKSEFVSTVSHELRTPLSIVKEGVNLIIDEIPGKIQEKQKKILTIAQENIKRLERIITDLLDISRIEAGRIVLRKESVDIVSLIQHFASAFRHRIASKGLELKLDLPKGEVDIYADRDKIIQVFTNLLYNSIKFTDRGYIKVSVEDKEYEVECSVVDTGRGISKEDLFLVFDKFQQFGRIPGSGEKGTGLGLSITKGIVELHRGNIWVESELGKGAKFIFTLPKYTPRIILREHVDDSIKKAIHENTKVSLLIVALVKAPDYNLAFEKRANILKDMSGLVKNNLRRDTKVICIEDVCEFAVILKDCGKNDMPGIKERLKKILDSYLEYEKLIGDIKVEFKHATYPDEADNDEALIRKVTSN